MRLAWRYFIAAAVLLSTTGAAAQGSPLGKVLERDQSADPRNRREPAPDYRLYEYGKEVYQVKLACDACPLADQPLDESLARRFLSDESLWTTLNRKEQDAVSAFLKERFSL